MAYWQQGDVLIKEFDEEKARFSWRFRLKNREKKELSEFVVAYGESTGHSHKIVGKIVAYIPNTTNQLIVVEVLEESTIYHEEHGPITLPPGKYYIDQVQEYDHFREEARRVVD